MCNITCTPSHIYSILKKQIAHIFYDHLGLTHFIYAHFPYTLHILALSHIFPFIYTFHIFSFPHIPYILKFLHISCIFIFPHIPYIFYFNFSTHYICFHLSTHSRFLCRQIKIHGMRREMECSPFPYTFRVHLSPSRSKYCQFSTHFRYSYFSTNSTYFPFPYTFHVVFLFPTHFSYSHFPMYSHSFTHTL